MISSDAIQDALKGAIIIPEGLRQCGEICGISLRSTQFRPAMRTAGNMAMHLNDSHEMTFEEIADRLDELWK